MGYPLRIMKEDIGMSEREMLATISMLILVIVWSMPVLFILFSTYNETFKSYDPKKSSLGICQ